LKGRLFIHDLLKADGIMPLMEQKVEPAGQVKWLFYCPYWLS
jgi:hypothetical protein